MFNVCHIFPLYSITSKKFRIKIFRHFAQDENFLTTIFFVDYGILYYHFLVVVEVLDGLLGTADLVVVPLGGYIEVVEGQRPEGSEESTVDVVPDLARMEEPGCLNQGINNFLTSRQVAGLQIKKIYRYYQEDEKKHQRLHALSSVL